MKKPCDAGEISRRAQQSLRQNSRLPPANERRLAVLDSTQHGSFSVYRLTPNDQWNSGSSFGGSFSSGISRTASPNYSTQLSTPNTQGLFDYEDSGVMMYDRTFRDSSGFSSSQVSEWFQTCDEFADDCDVRAMDTSGDNNARQFGDPPQSPERRDSVLSPQNTVKIVTTTTSHTYAISDAILLEPSLLCKPSPKERVLDDRIVRLWDSKEAFASAFSAAIAARAARNAYAASDKSSIIVTPLFAGIFSELFCESRQLAYHVCPWVTPCTQHQC